MNSYFANPFLLQGDGQTSTGGLQCNFTGISSSRYDQATQGLFCGNQAAMSGQYGSQGSPTGHHGHMPGHGEANNCRPGDLNGYDSSHHHVNAGWSTPAAAGAQQPDFNGHGGPSTPCENSIGSPVTPNSYNSPAQQAVPFYPWMGVVGKCCLILPFLKPCFTLL